MTINELYNYYFENMSPLTRNKFNRMFMHKVFNVQYDEIMNLPYNMIADLDYSLEGSEGNNFFYDFVYNLMGFSEREDFNTTVKKIIKNVFAPLTQNLLLHHILPDDCEQKQAIERKINVLIPFLERYFRPTLE